MCGICGIFEADGNAERYTALVGRMTATLAHRGPDDDGVFVGGAAAFGHRRLSIVDLARGHQPMFNEDGRVVVVCNGEIYNAPRLRDELIRKGHTFHTHCDIEVIAHLYEEHGLDFCARLEGMFAFGLYDRAQQRLILARDPLGIKPLFYAAYQGRLAFASEIKALLEDPGLPRRLDYQALHDYLSYGFALPPKTFFDTVRELEPGTMLIADGQGHRSRVYWQPSYQSEPIGEKQALAQFEDFMHQALQDHQLSDVPMGAFLSGGIDSSLVVAMMHRHLDVRLPTFTVGFAEAAYDEAPFAAMVAEQVGTEHHLIRVGAGEADVGLTRRIIEHFDQPFADTSAIPTYLICREIRKYVKVAFSGDGGDELFGGYPEFIRAPWLHRLGKMPDFLLDLMEAAAGRVNGRAGRRRQLTKALHAARLPAPVLVGRLHTYHDEADKHALYRPLVNERLGGYSSAEAYAGIVSEAGVRIFDQVTAARLRINLHADMLRKVDMMSMAHGLEVRVPLLDRRVVEFACRLPASLKVRRGTSKYLLRREAERLLPRAVARKPKQGFSIPLDTWANPAFKSFLRSTLLGGDARLHTLMAVSAVEQTVARFESGDFDRSQVSRYQVYQRLYQLLGFELWLRRWNPSL